MWFHNSYSINSRGSAAVAGDRLSISDLAGCRTGYIKRKRKRCPKSGGKNPSDERARSIPAARLGCVRRSAQQQIASRRCTTRSTYPKRGREREREREKGVEKMRH